MKVLSALKNLVTQTLRILIKLVTLLNPNKATIKTDAEKLVDEVYDCERCDVELLETMTTDNLCYYHKERLEEDMEDDIR